MRATDKDVKIGFVVYHYGNAKEEYQHIHIELKRYVADRDKEYYGDQKAILCFTWQGSTVVEKENHFTDHWYAFKIEIPPSSSTDTIDESIKLLHSLQRKWKKYLGQEYATFGSDVQPTDFVQFLATAGIERVVYDDRFSRLLLIKDILPDEYRAYVVEKGYQGYTCVVAKSEHEAKILEAQKWSEYVAENTYDTQSLQNFSAWVAAGMPMQIAYATFNSDRIKPLDEILTIERRTW